VKQRITGIDLLSSPPRLDQRMRRRYAASSLLPLLLTLLVLPLSFGQSNDKRTLGSSEPIRGVNLGGWLVTEQWYSALVPTIDRSID